MRQRPLPFPLFALISIVTTIGYGQTKASLGPAPGTLVDIGGHKLHISCVGPAKAGPIVIFEAGGGGFSKDWASVPREKLDVSEGMEIILL